MQSILDVSQASYRSIRSTVCPPLSTAPLFFTLSFPLFYFSLASSHCVSLHLSPSLSFPCLAFVFFRLDKMVPKELAAWAFFFSLTRFWQDMSLLAKLCSVKHWDVTVFDCLHGDAIVAAFQICDIFRNVSHSFCEGWWHNVEWMYLC